MESEEITFTTAWELLNDPPNKNGSIITFCEKIDKMLGGGIQLGQITELVGMSGVGKTQLCLQLAVDVHMPKILSGVEGGVVYIDTEGGYKSKRFVQIAEAAVQHCRDIAYSDVVKENLQTFTVESILERTYVMRCIDLTRLLSVLKNLENFIITKKHIKLIIVDSFTFHFRDDELDQRERRRILFTAISLLNNIAIRHNIAVVTVNQMTTKFGMDSLACEAPALNELLTRNTVDQLFLIFKHSSVTGLEEKPRGPRLAVLYKSSHSHRESVPFQVTEHGIRAISEPW